MVPGECEEGTAHPTQYGIVSRHIPSLHVLSLQGYDSHQGWVSSPVGVGVIL